MKKRESRGLFILAAAILLSFILPGLITLRGRSANHSPVPFTPGLGFALAAVKPDPPGSAGPTPAKKDFYTRAFSWTGADKKPKQAAFLLAKSQVKSELSQFGVARGMEHALLLEKKGFTKIGMQRGLEVFMVNYQEIFLRSLGLFNDLTETLHGAVEQPPPNNILLEFLVFVQAIKYQLPPFYYNNKFINSFFPPLICLYEQYGDCDSKSVLLAVFLTCQDKNEKTALLLINHLGLKHSILLVKGVPGPGMSSVFITGKGYYVPLEASSPGWAPGFVSQRVWSAISTGNFRFLELP